MTNTQPAKLITRREFTATIAMPTKSRLEWDAKAEKFTNNAAANKLLRYDYRPPLKSPA